ncbi:MAG: hypothetical protein KDK53_20845 [Maritimibacter sp.]|nr:hypothetical protein [Maritimibacter sp.]
MNLASGGEQAIVVLAHALIDECFAILVGIHRSGSTVLLFEQNAETAFSTVERGHRQVCAGISAGGMIAELQ